MITLLCRLKRGCGLCSARALHGPDREQDHEFKEPASRDSLQMLPTFFWQADRMRVATPRSISSLVMLFTAACRDVTDIKEQLPEHSFPE